MSIRKSVFFGLKISKKMYKFVSDRYASFSATGQISFQRDSILKVLQRDINKKLTFRGAPAFTSSVAAIVIT